MTGSGNASKRVLLCGPLAEYGPGYAAELTRQGFMPLSAKHQLRLLAHLSRWMESQGLGAPAMPSTVPVGTSKEASGELPQLRSPGAHVYDGKAGLGPG